MEADGRLTGILLCRAGEHRLGFAAIQVVAVEPWTEGEPVPHARQGFALAAARGRVLVSESGDSLGVDAIEVFREATDLMPPPRILVGGMGGSLRGFVRVKEKLWPILGLAEFSRFLSARGEAK